MDNESKSAFGSCVSTLFGGRPDPEKALAFLKDFQAGKKHTFKFVIGERVRDINSSKHYVVISAYFENGEARYVVYPPGKRTSLGYHVWIKESELEFR